MVDQKELIGLLARRAGVVAWEYDAEEDCLVYCLPSETTFFRVRGFQAEKESEAWSFLWGKAASGFVDVRKTPWRDDMGFRLTYLRAGKSGDVVGFAEELASGIGGDAQTIDAEALFARMGADLVLLRGREKGVLFAMEATKAGRVVSSKAVQEQAFIDLLEQTIRAEFRGRDIFGRISETRYLVFFRGELPIDVVERRAQHFLDEFSRRALDSTIAACCTIGIAVTGSGHSSAQELVSAAEQALNEAIARGANHYRMYENERY